MRVPQIIGLVAVASLLPLAGCRPPAPSAENTVETTHALCAEAVQQVRQYRRPRGVETIGQLVDSAPAFFGSRVEGWRATPRADATCQVEFAVLDRGVQRVQRRVATWRVDPATGSVVPLNDLARVFTEPRSQ